jgi:hypothetical protein
MRSLHHWWRCLCSVQFDCIGGTKNKCRHSTVLFVLKKLYSLSPRSSPCPCYPLCLSSSRCCFPVTFFVFCVVGPRAIGARHCLCHCLMFIPNLPLLFYCCVCISYIFHLDTASLSSIFFDIFAVICCCCIYHYQYSIVVAKDANLRTVPNLPLLFIVLVSASPASFTLTLPRYNPYFLLSLPSFVVVAFTIISIVLSLPKMPIWLGLQLLSNSNQFLGFKIQ